MNQHMNKPPVSPCTLRQDIPLELGSIVLDMLAKDPADRPADASAVAARLAAVLPVNTSAAGQTLSGEASRWPYPGPAEASEIAPSLKHPQALQLRRDPRVSRRPSAGTSSSLSILPSPQLQVAPSACSWLLLAFDPSGRWLASADGDGTITLWDAASGLPVRSWSAEAHVLAMAAGPDNQLAVGGDDGCARIWNLERAKLRGPFRGHVGGVQAVALDHSGTRLATGDADGVLRRRDPLTRVPSTTR